MTDPNGGDGGATPDPFSFATADDLRDRGATLTVSDVVANEILADATDHLQGIIGRFACPPATSTFTVYLGCGPQWVDIPMQPVVTIDSVTLNGSSIEYRRQGDSIRVIGPGELAVTVEWGYDTIPRELVSWTCVLASQALSTLGDLGTLGAGEVSSVGIDDFRKSYKQQADRGVFALPEAVEARLAARYGSGVAVTEQLS